MRTAFAEGAMEGFLWEGFFFCGLLEDLYEKEGYQFKRNKHI